MNFPLKFSPRISYRANLYDRVTTVYFCIKFYVRSAGMMPPVVLSMTQQHGEGGAGRETWQQHSRGNRPVNHAARATYECIGKKEGSLPPHPLHGGLVRSAKSRMERQT